MTNESVDITNLVESLRNTFVTWAVNYLFALSVSTPGLTWTALPVISTIFKKCLEWGANALSNSTVMMAFFLNTAIKKASQAQDYVAALDLKKKLSPEVSDDEYEKAERAEIAAFNALVRLNT